MHKKTTSDGPLERRIYEAAARDEETYLVLSWKEILEEVPHPPAWNKGKHKRPGRPSKKSRRGRKEEFTWHAMVLVLLLKTLHGLTYRETTSHLRNNPGLCDVMGLPRAPSPKNMMRALDRMGEAWLKRLNQRLLERPKRGVPVGPERSMPVWIRLE